MCQATSDQLELRLQSSDYGSNAAAFNCYFVPGVMPPRCVSCNRLISDHPASLAAAAAVPTAAMNTTGVVMGEVVEAAPAASLLAALNAVGATQNTPLLAQNRSNTAGRSPRPTRRALRHQNSAGSLPPNVVRRGHRCIDDFQGKSTDACSALVTAAILFAVGTGLFAAFVANVDQLASPLLFLVPGLFFMLSAAIAFVPTSTKVEFDWSDLEEMRYRRWRIVYPCCAYYCGGCGPKMGTIRTVRFCDVLGVVVTPTAAMVAEERVLEIGVKVRLPAVDQGEATETLPLATTYGFCASQDSRIWITYLRSVGMSAVSSEPQITFG